MDYKNKYIKYKNKYFKLKLKDGNNITKPSEYETAFNLKNGNVKVSNLVGRVLRGNTDEDFINLSPDVNRKLIMFTDSQGLKELIGLSTYDILLKIGYDKPYINELIKKGTQFKLIIAKEGEQILSATWDNLLNLIKSVPEYQHTKIPEFLTKNLEQLKANSGKHGYERIFKGITDKEKMTADRLNSSKGELWEVRKFLIDVLNLNQLYMGDGFTYNDNDIKELPEYFSRNQSISNLGEHVLIDLDKPVIPVRIVD